MNIVIATPRRCGTHVLIDIILNNMRDYRNRPLYIDLDKAWQQRECGKGLFGSITPESGYVIKTHMPIVHPDAPLNRHLLEILNAAVVVTVHRDVDAMVRSAERWWKRAEAKTVGNTIRESYEKFWAFWRDRPRVELEFEDLFRADTMRMVLANLSTKTGSPYSELYTPPISADRSKIIYANKALTRLMGRYAPRVDTTIHTLRKN